MANIQQITPFLHVPNLPQALDLFTHVPRFEVKFSMSNYAYLECAEAAARAWKRVASPKRKAACARCRRRSTRWPRRSNRRRKRFSK